MAEVLGVLSSAIALQQLAASVVKLRNAVSAIKRAPDDLQLLLEEAELINDLLIEVEAQHKQIYAVACPAPVWSRCLRSCIKAADRLNSFAKELEVKARKSKNLGRLCVVFNKDTIDDLRTGLDRAKNTLILAQQFYLKY